MSKKPIKYNGTPGDDVFGGDEGEDTLNGLGGNDTLFGNDDDDVLNGGDDNDTLHGGYGEDELNGGDGNDVLIGYAGADTLTGGAGADTFKIHSPWDVLFNNGWNWSYNRDGERDTITDFVSGEDKIDLNGLYRQIDTNGDGISEAYAVTWDDVEIQTLGPNQHRVVVHQVDGQPEWDLGIDVIGTAPVQSDFIF